MPLDRPWEACITMGTEWNYKPTHETYKSQEERLREIALWNFVYGESLAAVRPWVVATGATRVSVLGHGGELLAYESRAMVRHPLLTVFGEERVLGVQ